MSSSSVNHDSLTRAQEKDLLKWDTLEHTKNKDMYLGSREQIDNKEFIFVKEKIDEIETEHIKEKTNRYSPALYKIIEELLSNVIDQWTRFPTKVNLMSLSYDMATGTVIVLNNGPGMPVFKHSQ
jgi:DNA gyrase/topoisomerase IV subunit B